jgi:hypothetical protein
MTTKTDREKFGRTLGESFARFPINIVRMLYSQESNLGSAAHRASRLQIPFETPQFFNLLRAEYQSVLLRLRTIKV